MPQLTTSAIFVITAVTIVCFVLALFSAGVIQPYLRGNSPTTTLPGLAVNSPGTAISATALYFDYIQHPTLAAINYTEQLVYIMSNITSVQNNQGHYESCMNPSESFLYGCSYASQMSGWIVWTWDNPAQASSVPTDTNFVAECYVIGMSSGNLFLNSCIVAQY